MTTICTTTMRCPVCGAQSEHRGIMSTNKKPSTNLTPDLPTPCANRCKPLKLREARAAARPWVRTQNCPVFFAARR
jgi:hypothetical protein